MWEGGDGEKRAAFIYVAMNMHWQAHTFELPRLPAGCAWRQFMDTMQPSPLDVVTPGHEVAIKSQEAIEAGPRSIRILVG